MRSTSSLAQRLRNVERRVAQQRLTGVTFLSDGSRYWDSRTACEATREDIERLAARGHQVVVRCYPEGFLDAV